MNELEKEKLYEAIDNDEELTDSERRESYFAEIAEQEAQERFEQDYS